MDTFAIRNANRSTRASLSAEQITDASLRVTEELWRQPYMSRCKRIAAYFAFDGEIDCRYIIDKAWEAGREIYLPVIQNRSLAFAQYRANTPLATNQFGIPEPVCTAKHLLKPSELDIVLAPLVAFDDNGNRVGMGAGFYDRSFRFLRYRLRWTHPQLIGLAHDFQKAAKIKASSWDIPLHGAITDARAYSFA
jgi:5-formyltetrahydrofolate cyclo-ligase